MVNGYEYDTCMVNDACGNCGGDCECSSGTCTVSFQTTISVRSAPLLSNLEVCMQNKNLEETNR